MCVNALLCLAVIATLLGVWFHSHKPKTPEQMTCHATHKRMAKLLLISGIVLAGIAVCMDMSKRKYSSITSMLDDLSE